MMNYLRCRRYAMIFTIIIAYITITQVNRVDALYERDSKVGPNLIKTANKCDTSVAPPIMGTSLKDICLETGGEEAYAKAKIAAENLKRCFSDILFYAEMPSKMEESKPIGELDTVFDNYCKHTFKKRACIENFLTDTQSCVSERHRASRKTIVAVADTILKFVCQQEGEFVAIFVSEKGFQCVDQQWEGVERCIKRGLDRNRANETIFDKQDGDVGVSCQDGPAQPLTVDATVENCKTICDVCKCVVDQMQKCANSAPANVVHAVLHLMVKVTECSKYASSVCDLDPYASTGTRKSTRTFALLFTWCISVLLVVNYGSVDTFV